ncbi:MAG TPA: DUF5667 domain-containing protein [Candidatus Limnocylindria bacterium]|nr:DUF5667 domain-containing protein [Candidatus Limnocylindria bacterium]
MSDNLPRPQPRAAFKRALRAQLMAQAPGVLGPRETVWSLVQRGWLRPALVAAAIVLLLASGTSRAAADSLPGDAAFLLKRAAEQVQLAFALDDTTRLQLLAEQADHRLAELAEAVSARPDNAPVAEVEYAAAVRTLTGAVDAMRGQPGASEDKRTLAEDVVDAAHAKHQAVLDDLAGKVSPSERGDVQRAKDQLDNLHPSDRPARTAEPTDRSDGTRSPQPVRTATPTREAEPTRSPESTRSGDQPRTPTPTPPVRR